MQESSQTRVKSWIPITKGRWDAGKSERLALIVVQRQYDGDIAALQSRRSAAIGYGKVMDNLASLHAKLKVEAIKKARLRDVAEQIGPDIANLKDAISEVQTRSK